ncbi:MAG: NAD(P)H-dependent glycerol-3-phosphate dehydrogenase, partial [Acidimicrobiales bacterium]
PYLPGRALPASLTATASLGDALEGAGLVVLAVPSHGARSVLEKAAAHIEPGAAVLSLTKGLEQGTLMRASQVALEVLGPRPVAALTGPNLSREVGDGHPTASVVASGDALLAAEVQRLLATSSLRVYTNTDLVGSEIAGAVKNVIALASGMADGLGFGANTRAALITRGLAELTRLGCALGGDPLTFGGLAGLGDLVATCTSPDSRNRQVGEALGRGRSVPEVESGMAMVAEGVRSTPAVIELAGRAGVEMPIAEQVAHVLSSAKSAREVIPALMGREVRAELGAADGCVISHPSVD